MILTTLVENASISSVLGAELGLSLLLQMQSRTILFDTGKSDLFLQNAQTLGFNLDCVDLAIVSHGHHDHGGGLAAFLKANNHAPIYIRAGAFERHLSERLNAQRANIGLDPKLLESGRFVLTGRREEIGKGLTLFSSVMERALFSECNASILMQRGELILPDDFSHEQNLIVTENGKSVLIAGCAHCGIVNILRRAEKELGRMPDVVIGGFHLQSPSTKKVEPEARIRAIAKVLGESGAVFYTGHCTGDEPYAILRETLGEQIRPLHTGTVIQV